MAEDHKPSIGKVCEPLISPESEPALELHSRAVPSVEAHHYSVGPDTGRNSGGRGIIKKEEKGIKILQASLTSNVYLFNQIVPLKGEHKEPFSLYKGVGIASIIVELWNRITKKVQH